MFAPFWLHFTINSAHRCCVAKGDTDLGHRLYRIWKLLKVVACLVVWPLCFLVVVLTTTNKGKFDKLLLLYYWSILASYMAFLLLTPRTCTPNSFTYSYLENLHLEVKVQTSKSDCNWRVLLMGYISRPYLSLFIEKEPMSVDYIWLSGKETLPCCLFFLFCMPIDVLNSIYFILEIENYFRKT